MEEPDLHHSPIVGRDEELTKLKQFLVKAISGNGSTVIITGEPGMGKTRLVEEFRHISKQMGVKILAGSASVDSAHPFEVFSKALAGLETTQLFHEEEYLGFAKLFAINSAGLLLGQAGPEGETGLDADIFAGMLSAVQDFVRDSFDNTGQQLAGLGRLEYGDMKIIIEHGDNLFITAVFMGTEHPDMKKLLLNKVKTLEDQYGTILQTWTRKSDDIAPVQEALDFLSSARFLVKKNLEGVKLENERIRIANHILDLIIEKAKGEPVVLIIEDLHLADDSSLFVFSFLARNVRDQRVAVIGTIRQEGDRIAPALQTMILEGTVDTIRLDKLSLENVITILDKIYTPNSFPESFKSRLHADCQGNAFFVMELLMQMSSDGSISMVDGKYELMRPDYSIPGTVEEVVSRRLEGLGMEALALAEYASCIGREFPVVVAMSIGSLADPGASLRALGDARIIMVHGDSAEFTHAFFYDFIYSNLSARWKTAHHRSLGNYYEILYSGKLDNVAYELARHFYRAGDSRRAADYCFKAGEKAESAFAASQAAKLFEEALESVRHYGRFPDQRERSRALLLRLGAIHDLVSDFQKAEVDYSEALSLSDSTMEKAESVRLLSNILGVLGKLEPAMEMVEKALVITGIETAEHWLLEMQKAKLLIYKGELKTAASVGDAALERLSSFKIPEKNLASAHNVVGGIYIRMGEYERGRSHYDKILDISGKVNDLNGLANSYNNIGATYQWTGDLKNAIVNYDRSLAMWQKQGNLFGESSTLSNIGSALMDQGDFDRALERLQRSLVIRRKIGNSEGVAVSLSNIGAIYYRKGELNRALPYMQESLDIRLRAEDRFGIANSYNNLGELLLWKGNLEMALDYMQKALAIEEDISDKEGVAFSQTHIGFILMMSEQPQEAHKMLEKGIATSKAIGLNEYALIGLRWLVEASIEEGDLPTAENLLAEVETMTLNIAQEQEKVSVEKTRALVLVAKGEYAKAIACLKSAERQFSDLGMALLRTQVSLSLGKVLMASGDREFGTQKLMEACAAAEILGLTHIAEQCRKELES